MSTFDSTKTPLPEIIKQSTEGKVQLPDFLRGRVWDGRDIRFQVRPVENVMFAGARSDDFDRIYERRRQSLLDIVEQAMGKVLDRGVIHDKFDDSDNDEIRLMAVNS